VGRQRVGKRGMDFLPNGNVMAIGHVMPLKKDEESNILKVLEAQFG